MFQVPGPKQKTSLKGVAFFNIESSDSTGTMSFQSMIFSKTLNFHGVIAKAGSSQLELSQKYWAPRFPQVILQVWGIDYIVARGFGQGEGGAEGPRSPAFRASSLKSLLVDKLQSQPTFFGTLCAKAGFAGALSKEHFTCKTGKSW